MSRSAQAAELAARQGGAALRALRAAERDGATPEASRDQLLAGIAAEGIPDYAAFQAGALGRELRARDDALQRPPDPRLAGFFAMNSALSQMERAASDVLAAFDASRTIPLNMRLIASRLGTAGGAISTMSINYSAMSDDMAGWIRRFVGKQDSVSARIREAAVGGLFMTSLAKLAQEMLERFEAEEPCTGVDAATERKTLAAIVASSREASVEHLRQVELEAAQLGRNVLDLKRHTTGLGSVRMMCRIESASLPRADAALTAIVEQLDACQNMIERHLDRIIALNHEVQGASASLRTRRQRAPPLPGEEDQARTSAS
ncbi:branched-chain amino acid aminotransferase [Oceanicola granulosus HTCC2516]|uniref:Branched-chain amino acid aminotransferase n=1 Tax=Oceanicola granulosus (strain ATCC BAA-861 / DSM 15982 / KCTC 12143 / HTCC2516) TaxID=314256 RepID=Q2CD67_OCEGH|nr:hypothetical protein [Oceanicola granulosus]EAR50611.1 branched-chain amino acid aminotransferase [Oceanicola granulosus HTCC2516]